MTRDADNGLDLGQWIKRRRDELDLTQDALAERLGYASSTLKKIERGVRRPSRELAARLADALEISAEARQKFLVCARSAPLAAEPAPPPQPRRTAAPAVQLIGRASERAALWQQLRNPSCRLVTLVGPGGIGKTSIALALGAEASEAQLFADGAVFVALSDLRAVEEVPRAIAEVLAVTLRGPQPAATHLCDLLREREMLLVLDNLEHLLAGEQLAALIGQILTAATGVRLLATSRERLRLREEWVLDVGGLALPATDHGPQVVQAEAVQLFVECARRVAPGFVLRPEHHTAVAHLCRRLEGMPLAIELAAAWVRALTPAEIATEIERALDFLAHNARNAPPRHRSVRAALDHSWSLLNTDEQHVLARLTIFQGGFERAAAAQVADAGLPTLLALIDKSLLRSTGAGGITHYTLHELVRQYASERLAANPAEQHDTTARHTHYYSALLQQAAVTPAGALTPTTRTQLTRAAENLRAVWFRAAAAGDAATIARMARGLSLLCESNSWLFEAITLFGCAAEGLRAAGTRATPVLALVLGTQGYFMDRAGQLRAAQPLLQEGLALARAGGIALGVAPLELNLGIAEQRLGNAAAARAHFEAAMHSAHPEGDKFSAAWAALHLGRSATESGDYAAAQVYLTRFRAAWDEQGYSIEQGVAWVSLAEVARLEGRTAAALALTQQALYAAAAANDRFVLSLCLGQLGVLAGMRGEFDEAGYLLAECVELMHELGDTVVLSGMLTALAAVAIERGNYDIARSSARELLQLAQIGLAAALSEAAYTLALLYARTGNPTEALALLIALDDVVASFQVRQQAAHLRDTLAEQLAAECVAAATTQAHSRPLLPWIAELCQ